MSAEAKGIFDEPMPGRELELHEHSIEQIEAAFASALEQLASQPYDVRIKSLNRHPEHAPMAHFHDIVEIALRVEATASRREE
jgi:hypothetical protein